MRVAVQRFADKPAKCTGLIEHYAVYSGQSRVDDILTAILPRRRALLRVGRLNQTRSAADAVEP